MCVFAWHLEALLNTCGAWTEHIFNYTWFDTDVRRQVTMDTSHNIVPANMHNRRMQDIMSCSTKTYDNFLCKILVK